MAKNHELEARFTNVGGNAMAQIERRIQKLEQKSGSGSAIAMIFLKVPADMSEDDRLEASEELANAHGVRVGTVLCVTHTRDGPPPLPEFLTGDEV
jgi:hypothetical protein